MATVKSQVKFSVPQAQKPTSKTVYFAGSAPQQEVLSSGEVMTPEVKASIQRLTPKEQEARRQKKQAMGRSVKASDFGYGYGTDMLSGADTVMSGANGFYSAQLSTDFLQKPQSDREFREIAKHFYDWHAVVGSAIDLHTEIPLSKLRLTRPKPRTHPPEFKSAADYGRYILYFYKRMIKEISLFQNLIMATHHLHLDGGCYLFVQDGDVEVPAEVGHTVQVENVVTESGEAVEQPVLTPKEDREALELAYYQKKYRGWEKLVVLTLDQVDVTSYGFTNKVKVQLVPSNRERELVEQANQGDPYAQEIVNDMPGDVLEYLSQGQMIPLNTDPMRGSCAIPFTFRRDVRDPFGQSSLKRVLQDLMVQDKVRQAQSLIADRAMTPRRVVTAEGASNDQIDDLRQQVDLALMDPDYSIVSNTPITWDEMSSRDRLLDDSQINEHVDRRIHVGLSVTEALLSGESLYSGDRIKLEIINTKYSLLRELIQDIVQDSIFLPVAYRKGFVEINEWGDEEPLYPKMSFTRLALKDTQDLYDALFSLYQKGSLPISVILELFNLDPEDVKEQVEQDLLTLNDASFNEILRSAYSEVGRALVEKSPDLMNRVAKAMGIKIDTTPPKEEDGGGGGRWLAFS